MRAIGDPSGAAALIRIPVGNGSGRSGLMVENAFEEQGLGQRLGRENIERSGTREVYLDL